MTMKASFLISFLMLISSFVLAQSEPESSNSLLVKAQDGRIVGAFQKGSEIEFEMIDRFSNAVRGKVEQVKDSTIVVRGIEFPVQKIGRITISNPEKRNSGLILGGIAFGMLILGTALLLLLSLVSSFTTLIILTAYFAVFILSAGVPLIGVAIAFIFAGRNRKFLMGRRFKMAIVQLRATIFPNQW